MLRTIENVHDMKGVSENNVEKLVDTKLADELVDAAIVSQKYSMKIDTASAVRTIKRLVPKNHG